MQLQLNPRVRVRELKDNAVAKCRAPSVNKPQLLFICKLHSVIEIVDC